jgi:hypothetical protein
MPSTRDPVLGSAVGWSSAAQGFETYGTRQDETANWFLVVVGAQSRSAARHDVPIFILSRLRPRF